MELVTSLREWVREKTTTNTPGIVVMLLMLGVTSFFFLLGGADGSVVFVWIILSLCSLALYVYAFNYHLPEAINARKPFWNFIGRSLGSVTISSFAVAIAVLIVVNEDDVAIATGIINVFLQLLVTAPITWFVYKKYRSGKEEISVLQRELGQSSANVDFLRSQINPHFLFNILNTLYGTALQEKADKTSEGIQKLGDMMRFMLHENMMERISLAREVEYLRNYIALQRLRTDENSSIALDIDIPVDVPTFNISPMLLIPFVENAFKHGISFREPSYIRVGLNFKDDKLFFDVTNSIHTKQENDPERNGHGIGLTNVKQRLLLTYPKKHELIVRENGRDFFVHLTVSLK